ncbi:urease accessory protein UreD [Snodgrassella sp. CFCC 13594]|uniref:urease accessory protein UreD n=1 Tax=Snodgrassella sp. CFCC 13594 TaxID=1775559 RepID=UPI000835DD2D|nr:urease accessory protein UreD [Snodgrassella sp. CFCC 13594]
MHSELRLSTKQAQSDHTVLDDCYCTPPIKILTLPHTQTSGWPGTLAAMQMSSSPGLLAGDTIDVQIRLAAHTRLNLFTQAFTRVQAMSAANAEARQHTTIELAHGSHLSYLPHPLVLHADGALTQTTEINLADDCVLILGEIMACGRVLNGERWRFRYLSSHLAIRHHHRLVLSDNIQWHPQTQDLAVIGQMEDYSHQAGLYYVHTGISESAMRARVDALYQALSAQWPVADAQCLWGVSLANASTLCVRALAHQAQVLQSLLNEAATWLRQPQSPSLAPSK